MNSRVNLINPPPQRKLSKIIMNRKIKCTCNDSNCENTGQEGEVGEHIENCPCHKCHHAMGKLK